MAPVRFFVGSDRAVAIKEEMGVGESVAVGGSEIYVSHIDLDV